MNNKLTKLEEYIQRLVTPAIQSMKAYHVPSSAGMLKLDAMENPYTWNDESKQRWLRYISSAEINRYPSPSAEHLRNKIKSVMRVPSELDVMLGNGSDEIIQILAMALNTDEASVLSLEPSFVMYKVIAETVGMAYHAVLLNSDFSLNMDSTLEAINKHQPTLQFYAVPNNPTGDCFSHENLRTIIEVSKGLVVIDEAYIAFTDADMIQLAVEYDNVLIMRTLSKVGLAGLRLGMLMGKTAWIEQFNKIRLPYNINVLTQITAAFALDNYSMLMQQAEKLKLQRAQLSAALRCLSDVEVFMSQANFILVRTRRDANTIFENLKSQGVLIKCLSGSHPLLKNCLRITVSTEEENARFLESFKRSLAT